MISSFLGECHQVWVHVTPATRALWAACPHTAKSVFLVLRLLLYDLGASLLGELSE